MFYQGYNFLREAELNNLGSMNIWILDILSNKVTMIHHNFII